MKKPYSMFTICFATLAFAGSVLAKGTDENPAQVEVINLPATQDVAITGTPSVNVASLPAVNVNDGTPIRVIIADAAPTYSFAGYTDIDKVVSESELFLIGPFFCREKFGGDARISNSREVREQLGSMTELSLDAIYAVLPPILGSIPFLGGSIPYRAAWFTTDESINDIWLLEEFSGPEITKDGEPRAEFGHRATVACSTPDF